MSHKLSTLLKLFSYKSVAELVEATNHQFAFGKLDKARSFRQVFIILSSIFLSFHTTPRRIAIQGSIIDKDSKCGVINAKAILYEFTEENDSIEINHYETDNDFRYNFSLIPNTKYKIEAFAQGYATGKIYIRTLTPNNNDGWRYERNIFITPQK